MIPALFALLLSVSADAPASNVVPDQAPINCDNCAGWNQPQAPFHIFGNTYYVGVHGLSSVLIKTRDGLILLDGDLPQSVPQIVANIRTLGFDVHDVRWVLASHAHFDHVGGIAALQRITGANVGASTLAAVALENGRPPSDDPQWNSGKATPFPAVAHVQAMLDGETLTLGETKVTAQYTPGHTPGGTTWSWRTCEHARCVNIIYADSLSPVSEGDFRFGDPSRTPTTADVLRRSIQLVRGMSCDVVISVHPEMSDVLGKAAANARDPGRNAFIDGKSCQLYADQFGEALDKRLREEAVGASH